MSPGGRFGLLVAVGAALTGCDDRPRPPIEPYIEASSEAEILEEDEPPDGADPPPAISPLGGAGPAADEEEEPPVIVPASHGDDAYASEELIVARRYVYRVRMIVPAGLGTGDVRLTVPAAELHVDVGHERLRARFVGDGWPVPPDSEVRLRRDRPGVYLFDGRGGRPLEPGELAQWFEGGPLSRRGPPLYVFATYGFPRGAPTPNDEEDPGELMCAFLAELASEPRDGLLRRCELGAPHLWRFGFWRAEQTAGVPVELPRSALRADERDPPRPISRAVFRSHLEAEALRRLDGGDPPTDDPPEDAPPRGLRVRNESATRAIIAIDARS